MARLVVDDHPNRVFKDDEWRYGKHHGTGGYLSIGDHGDTPAPHGELWAFAVEDPYTWDDDPRALYDDILLLEKPFVRAEIIMIGDTRYAIGFFPEPSD